VRRPARGFLVIEQVQRQGVSQTWKSKEKNIPALQVTTPFHRSSSERLAMKLYAPRILKLNTS
jgi:hypothetical protein